MKIYYVIVDFYPDLRRPDEVHTIYCPYSTYDDAQAAFEATLAEHNTNEYEVTCNDDFCLGYITYKGTPAHTYRLEIAEGELGYMLAE